MAANPIPNLLEENPSHDLSGFVHKTEQHCFAAGGFSEIYKGIYAFTQGGRNREVAVAIKVFRGVHTNPQELQKMTRRMNRESHLWSSLEHPNIVPFLGTAHVPDTLPCPALISKLCLSGPIMGYLALHPEANRYDMVKDIAKGLAYLHGRGAIHGDLKPHNILIDGGVARLCDFGRSRVIGHRGYTTEFAGTYRYLAPEILEPEQDAEENEVAQILTMEADVYSFAVTALEVITGKAPYFFTNEEFRIIPLVVRGDRPIREKYPPIPDTWWDMMTRCWAQNPQDRPPMTVVVSRLLPI
ncbi:hypothetical protein JAAARDRAFT_47314 [Jaapia argillacea MUCL 33604]|uniref:Protein kinase domain-containing protein n=1 Tax=Jaapia argillacea MUCL 33604 TaxID=933084 RepID=A0A067Q3U8_9AGAM|nr:hypothetical protein JAAARDRAFT_47314 [Jaapia argillacea MUCL 33604]